MSNPHAIIIGAGFTGVATAHDLALRGFDVTVVERGPLANGTSGRTHGLLHSGSRYAMTDQESARECIEENVILRKIVPQVIEPNGGVFAALHEADLDYREAFREGNALCHIPIKELTREETLRLVPNINPSVLMAFLVPDGTFDPLRLAMAFAATARANGARFRLYTEITDLIPDGQGNIAGVKAYDRANDKRYDIYGDIVVNATGPWAGQIAQMAGAHVPIKPTPGVMVAFDQRASHLVVNHLKKPGDGDLVIPQRRMLVVGTTSFEVEDLDYTPVFKDQVERMVECAIRLVPCLREAKRRGAYMATRPLVGAGGAGRSLSRTFKCFDHKETDGVDGFVTITGGKATTLRAMAEHVSDLVCAKLGLSAPCRTKEVPLLSYRQYHILPN